MVAKNCPVLDCCQLLGKKWVFPIIDTVSFSPGIRFNSLLKALNGISPKVLSLELKKMKKTGILQNISEKVNGKKNSKYFLTEQGKELWLALKTIKAWGAKWQLVPAKCENTNCAECKTVFGKK